MPKPLVAYFRVSTREQGRSGLGLDAQRAAIARFAEAEGFEIVAEFTEVEPGKGADALDRRPQLAAALAARCFGLMVWEVFMERPEKWSSGRFEKDGEPIRSRTYFRVLP